MPVVIGAGSHPFPFRTRKLSLLPPMVLRGKLCGRVGRCRHYYQGVGVNRSHVGPFFISHDPRRTRTSRARARQAAETSAPKASPSTPPSSPCAAGDGRLDASRPMLPRSSDGSTTPWRRSARALALSPTDTIATSLLADVRKHRALASNLRSTARPASQPREFALLETLAPETHAADLAPDSRRYQARINTSAIAERIVAAEAPARTERIDALSAERLLSWRDLATSSRSTTADDGNRSSIWDGTALRRCTERCLRVGLGFRFLPRLSGDPGPLASREELLRCLRALSIDARKVLETVALKEWLSQNGGFLQYGDRPPAMELASGPCRPVAARLQKPDRGRVGVHRALAVSRPARRRRDTGRPREVGERDRRLVPLAVSAVAWRLRRRPVMTGAVVAPGAVHIRARLTLDDQRDLAARCLELGAASAPFYTPIVRGGHPMSVKMLCLGRHWNARTYRYESTRSDIDQLPRAAAPDRAFGELAAAIARDAGFELTPDLCIVNWYAAESRMGLHQDKDESPSSLALGLPVVSISLGKTAMFLFGGLKRRDPVESDPVGVGRRIRLRRSRPPQISRREPNSSRHGPIRRLA